MYEEVNYEEVKKMRRNGASFCQILKFLNNKTYENTKKSLIDLEQYCNIEKVKKAKEDILNKIDMLNQIKEKSKEHNKAKELENQLINDKNETNEISLILKKEYGKKSKVLNIFDIPKSKKKNVEINDVEVFINGVKSKLNYDGHN